MQCPACGRDIEEGKRFCRFCGADTVPSEAAAASRSAGAAPGEAPAAAYPSPVAPPPPPPPEPYWEQVPPPPPGYGQQPPNPPPPGPEWQSPPPGWQPESPPPSRAPWIVAGILIFLLVAGGVAAGVYFLTKDRGKETTTTATTTVTTATTVTTVSSTTSVIVSTTLPPVTSITVGPSGEEYVYALGDLDSVLVYADTRIPELAERINQTAPRVPESVRNELRALMDSVQDSSEELSMQELLPGYEGADSSLQDAAIYMQYRIESTVLGIEAMWTAGAVSAGTPYFDDGRRARDDYRAAYSSYIQALPGD